MEPDPARAPRMRALLVLPDARGALFDEEMERTRARIESVHRASVSHDTPPAGSPCLRSRDG